MSNTNPIIKNTPAATFNNAIDSLAFINGMIKNTIALATSDQNPDEQKQLSINELNGFSLHIECVQSALESGFEQCRFTADDNIAD
jgi:hypothetical protein